MTDLEINMALAMAIGWKFLDVIPANPAYPSCKQCWVWTGAKWKLFDYRHWDVIGPIAERYHCFPNMRSGMWIVCVRLGLTVEAYTPQKAIALAVIAIRK